MYVLQFDRDWFSFWSPQPRLFSMKSCSVRPWFLLNLCPKQHQFSLVHWVFIKEICLIAGSRLPKPSVPNDGIYIASKLGWLVYQALTVTTLYFLILERFLFIFHPKLNISVTVLQSFLFWCFLNFILKRWIFFTAGLVFHPWSTGPGNSSIHVFRMSRG